jgi:eukaryotic-like serine/threonine-protein kinase
VPVTIGTRLGPYEIIAPIGAGGMGEVYRARDTKLNRNVAIEVLPATVAQDPERRERFEREARTIAALNHPNIVTIQRRFPRLRTRPGSYLIEAPLGAGGARTIRN